MIAIGRDLYMFGGCGTNGRLNDLWKFDTKFEHWTNLGTSKLRGRGGPTLFALDHGNKIIVVAGFAGEETRDAHVFDTKENVWEDETHNFDQLRRRSVSAFGTLPLQKKCYLFGGEVNPSTLEHEGAGSFEDDLVIFDERDGTMERV